MTPDESQRMIHIRINNAIHKELRKAAAEYDLTIQDIVSEAVAERVDAFEAEAKMERAEKMLEKAERKTSEYEKEISEKLESINVTIEEECDAEARGEGTEASFSTVIFSRFDEIEVKLEGISSRLAEIHCLLEMSDE